MVKFTLCAPTQLEATLVSPCLGIKKRYKWKKMNFTTDLPKRNPLVSYIVASAVRCEKFFPGGSKNGPVFRMHAVILKVKSGTQVGMVP